MALLIIFATVLFFLSPSKPQSSTSETSGNTSALFPSSQSFSVATTSTGSSSTMLINASDGGTVLTNDFIHNGVTLPDTANSGRYLLAGNLGYCISDAQQCQAGTTTNFNIFYNSTDDSFIIALLEEPLGQVRLEAQQFLMMTLGISQNEMCRLNYRIGTTSNVNSFYGGKNLGFSFCPRATVLP